MAQRTCDSEILTEGYKSYHKALFAVIEFRRQAADAIRRSLKAHMAELADAMAIDPDMLDTGMAYTKPDRVSQSYDGTEAEVGFRMPKDWKHPWHMYFYLLVGDEEPCQFLAMVVFKEADSPIEKLRAVAGELGPEVSGFEADGRAAWISEAIPDEGPCELSSIADAVLDRWIKLWKRVGGMTPLVPRAD